MSPHDRADRDGTDRGRERQQTARAQHTETRHNESGETGTPSSTRAGRSRSELQRRYGNQAVGRLVGHDDGLAAPGESVETAADRTARRVLESPVAATQHGSGQRGSGAGLATPPTSRADHGDLDGLAGALATARGGRPIGDPHREAFEARFGMGLANVRVHDGHRAARVTSALDARALTAGERLYFGAGEFAPDTPEGRGLLAHELAHVAQFRAGRLADVARQAVGQAPPTDEPAFGTFEELERVRNLIKRSLLDALIERTGTEGGPASVRPEPGQTSGVEPFTSRVRARVEASYPPEVAAYVSRELDEIAGIRETFGEFTLNYLSAAELLSWFLGAQPELQDLSPVAYGVERYAHAVADDIAMYLTFGYARGRVAPSSDLFGLAALTDRFSALVSDWGNPARIVELELEGVLAAIVERREWLDEATDDATRAAIQADISRLARQALLLNRAAGELREIGDAQQEGSALDREVERQAPAIERLTGRIDEATAAVEAASTEEATLAALGDALHLLGVQDLNLPQPLTAVGTEERQIEPETAFPETTGRAVSEMVGSLEDRIESLSSQVEGLHERIVPPDPAYTLPEFARVYRNWVAFYSPAAREADYFYQQLHNLFSGLSMVAGMAGGPEGGMLRLHIQRLVEQYLPLPGASADFATEIEAADVGREEVVTGTASDPEYLFAEQFAGTEEPRTPAGEAASRRRALQNWIRERAADVEQVRTRPESTSIEEAAVATGLVSSEQVPSAILLHETNRERWNYLLSHTVEMGAGEGSWIHEQRGMPPEVAEYLLAAEQLVATRERPHVPTVEGPSGEPVRIGTEAVRRGGLEAVMDLHGAGPVRPGGREPPGIQEITRDLIGDLEAYIEEFIATGTGAERIAATYMIASAEYRGQERFEEQFDATAIASAVAQAVGLATLLSTVRALGGRLGFALSRAFSQLMNYMGLRSDAATIIAISGWFDRTAEVESFRGARTMGYVASDLLAEIGQIIVDRAVDVGIDFARAGNRLRTVPETRDQLLDGLDPVLQHEVVQAQVQRHLQAELQQVRGEEAAQQASDPEAGDLSSVEQGVIERYAMSTATRSPDRRLGTDTEGRPQRLLEHEFLQFEELVGSDGRFQLPELEAAYSRYVGRKGSDAADRREWAMRQTTGRPREIFEAQLGPDYARQPRQAGGGRGVAAHHRGYIGETLAQHALAAEGHEILIAHAGLEGVTHRGIDIVTIKDDRLYLIDNKAQTAPGTVHDASSLTENLDYNVQNQVRPTLERIAGDESYPAEMRATVRRALAALDRGDVTRAVTAANVAPDVSLKTDVSSTLEGHDVEFIDLMGARDIDRSALPRTAADLLTPDGSRFADDELEGYYVLYRERMENLGGEIMSRQEWAESL